jgi:Acetyltransferase (GNAT) domain
MLKDYGWIDLGFRLAQPSWGNGLATEVASAWVRAAFASTASVLWFTPKRCFNSCPGEIKVSRRTA